MNAIRLTGCECNPRFFQAMNFMTVILCELRNAFFLTFYLYFFLYFVCTFKEYFNELSDQSWTQFVLLFFAFH